MCDSKTRSKLWREKQKLNSADFMFKERERQKQFRLKKKQFGKGKSSTARSGSVHKNDVSTLCNGNVSTYKIDQEQEEQRLHDVMSQTYELNANHVILRHPFTMLVEKRIGLIDYYNTDGRWLVQRQKKYCGITVNNNLFTPLYRMRILFYDSSKVYPMRQNTILLCRV